MPQLAVPTNSEYHGVLTWHSISTRAGANVTLAVMYVLGRVMHDEVTHHDDQVLKADVGSCIRHYDSS